MSFLVFVFCSLPFFLPSFSEKRTGPDPRDKKSFPPSSLSHPLSNPLHWNRNAMNTNNQAQPSETLNHKTRYMVYIDSTPCHQG